MTVTLVAVEFHSAMINDNMFCFGLQNRLVGLLRDLYHPCLFLKVIEVRLSKTGILYCIHISCKGYKKLLMLLLL